MKKGMGILALFIVVMMLCIAGCGNKTPEQTGTAVAEENVTQAVQDETGTEAAGASHLQGVEETTEAEEAVEEIDYLALVNKLHPLPNGWEAVLETEHMTNSVGDDVEVEKKAYESYLQLKDALEQEGVYVDLDSAYRSVAEQQRIMDDFIQEYGKDYAYKTVATPGFSEHHTGLALDLYLIVDGKDITENEEMIQYPETWAKIHEKLADYGFILRYLDGKEHITGYGYEPWHIRYIDDVDLAKKIVASGKTLEGYLGEVNETEVRIDYGTSNIYSQEELENAAVLIKCDFASWEGCELHSLRYVGDESNSEKNQEWLNSLGNDTTYTQVIEFLGDFYSPKDGNGWEPDKEYKNYQWWLGKTENGWELVLSNQESEQSPESTKDDEETTKDDDSSQTKDGFSITPSEGNMFCMTESGVNIRSGYTQDDSVLGVVNYGEQIRITGIVKKDGNDYGWYQIDYNGQTAYVTSQYFSVKQPAGERLEEQAEEVVEEAVEEPDTDMENEADTVR